jgi:hypothetical protein
MSQRETILRALKDAGPDRGVHGFEWEAQGMLRYAARIHELREQGYTITSTHEALTPGGATGARYRLMADPIVPLVEPLVQDGDDDQVHEQFAMLSELAFTPARKHWQDEAA